MLNKLFLVLFLLIGIAGISQSVTFTNVSDNFEVEHSFGVGSQFGGGVSFVDFDQDGFDDLTFTTNEPFNMSFYSNDGTGLMYNFVPTDFLNDGNTKHPLWADIDNDGDYDLFVSANDTGNRLYLNNGNLELEDITEVSGLDLPSIDNNSFGSVFADFNKDGNLDLYIVNRTLDGYLQPPHNLMHFGNGDGTFDNVGIETNTQDGNKASLATVAFDYDSDGFDDVYVAQDKFDGNTMLKNETGAYFSDTSSESESLIYLDGMNADVADVDNNGFLDIYVTASVTGSVLMMNNGDGTFTEEALERGCKMLGEAGWGASFVDIDNDSDLDLFVSAAAFSIAYCDNLFINDGTGYFTEADASYGLESVPLDYSFGNMFGDINNDGFPDLAVSNQYTPSILWQNSGNENNWLKYKLEGTVSNRDATGSYLDFYLDGVSYLRSTHCGQGFLSQQSYTKIFGMGAAESVDSLSIHWPNGYTDWYYDLTPDSLYHFTEGETTSLSFDFSNGASLCEGESTEISTSGDYVQIVWNGESMAPAYVVNEAQTVSVEVTYEFGIVQNYEIEIESAGEGFELLAINGLTICPGEIESQVEFSVQSGNVFELFIDETLSDLNATLALGEYGLSILDAEGCVIEEQFEVSHSQEPEFEINTDNVLCFGEDNGSISLLIEAAEPFSFTLDDNEASLFTPFLTAGDYMLNVVDGNNCSYDEVITILEPEQLSVVLSSEPDYGANEGSVTAEISGGTSPYTFNEEAVTELSDLSQGFYDVEICDANNCCLEDEIEVEFTIGIEEKIKEQLILYPNPTDGEITLANYSGGVESLKLVDALGKLVFFHVVNVSSSSVTINIEHLPIGMYFLKSTTEGISFEINKK